MKRRDFIKYSAMTAAGLAVNGPIQTTFSATKPNFVIIMADDLGFGDIGCYGSRAIKTPSIDSLATDGMKFSSFYSSSPVCSPSRCGLLTGRYPSRVGVNGVYFPSENPSSKMMHMTSGIGDGMNPREVTIAQVMKRAEYKTCCIGKWHLGDKEVFRPNHRGFDHFLGLHYSNDMTPLPLYRNDEVVEADPVNQDMLTQKYTKEALDWLDANGRDPFFLYLPHTFPHEPLHASDSFRGKSNGGIYGDCVEEVDWSVGQVLSKLEELGVADNTFVFFTSDNGPWFQGDAGNNRGRKGEIFDGGMRVPGIAKWPGVIKPGSETDAMAMNIDLYATVAAIAGAKTPGDRIIDGRDMTPIFKGGNSQHEALYFYDAGELVAIRTQEWKYHREHKHWATKYGILPYGPVLYDLKYDRKEAYDVSGKYPDVSAKMARMIEEWETDFKKDVSGKS